MQIDIVRVDVVRVSVLQKAFSLRSREAIEDGADVRLFLNLFQVLVHQLVGPVITHTIREKVVAGGGQGFDSSDGRVVNLLEAFIVDFEPVVPFEMFFHEFVHHEG